MGKVMDVLKGLPGLVPEDAYDDNYPDGVAGHVNAGARIETSEDAVRTPFGIDHAFTGEHIDRDRGDRPEMVGEEETDRHVRKATEQARRKDHRQPVDQSADEAIYGNVTLANTNPMRLVYHNKNRASLCLTNQSSGVVTVYIGNNGGISTSSPNTVLLASGQSRTFFHKQAVWIVGPIGAVVDFVEENYAA